MSSAAIVSKEKVCVIGMGYIGLPTAALLASRGFVVHGVDVVQDVVDTINRGDIHIVEPALDVFVREAVQSERLKCDTKPAKADVFVLAVPTPFKDNHVPNIDYIEAATRSIASFVEKGNIVILESTSPVGTTERVAEILEENGVDTSEIYLAHCPERVLPGHIMRELVENDRIVGGINEESTKKTTEFYKKFVEGGVLETNAKTAEMAKLSENSYRDVNIAFANELSMLSEKYDIDPLELIRLANHHPRVNILQPGTGVGGHCISVDPWFLISGNEEHTDLMYTSRKVNLAKTQWVIDKIEESAELFKAKNKKKPTIACLGLAYKPDIDDLRESPAMDVVNTLIDNGHKVKVVEPNVEVSPIEGVALSTLEKAIQSSDIVVILVAHKEFFAIAKPSHLDFCGVTKADA